MHMRIRTGRIFTWLMTGVIIFFVAWTFSHVRRICVRYIATCVFSLHFIFVANIYKKSCRAADESAAYARNRVVRVVYLIQVCLLLLCVRAFEAFKKTIYVLNKEQTASGYILYAHTQTHIKQCGDGWRSDRRRWRHRPQRTKNKLIVYQPTPTTIIIII